MNFKATCVGIGMTASTLLGGCGQKAGKVVEDIGLPTKITAKINDSIQLGDTIKFNVPDTIYLPKCEPDTIIRYFKKPEIVGDMIIDGKKIRNTLVGERCIQSCDMQYITPIYRDVKLPKDATQIGTNAKGDSIDYIF